MKLHEETEELRFAVIDGIALSGELYGALFESLKQNNVSPKEQKEMQTKYQALHGTLKRIIRLITTDVRGMHNAKTETIEIKMEELLDLLPPEKRVPLLKRMLEKENSHVGTPLR